MPAAEPAPESLDPTDVAPVLTPEGWGLLRELSAGADYAEADVLALSTRLRAEGHPAERVAAVLTQWRLRAQARTKLGEFAERMVFTPAGLEQATRLPVAALHAGRFARAGVRRVADLGCGIGADAMAFAALDLEVTAVERDPTLAAVATVNLMPFPSASVVCADALDWVREQGLGAPDDAAPADASPAASSTGAATSSPESSWGLWLDPARRVLSTGGSQRVFDPEAFSPPLSFVESLADAGHPVGVKLGPGLPHEAVPAGCEAQWVSVAGEVTEAVLWFNRLARPGVRRSALVMGAASSPDSAAADSSAPGTAELTAGTDFGDSPQLEATGPAGVSGWLYEPDGAVIRAGLVTDLIQREFGAVQGRLLDTHIAYFCADELVSTPFARAYEVLQIMPYQVKGLRRWARETGVTRLDIKKRGMAVTPEEVRRLVMSGQKKGKVVTSGTAGPDGVTPGGRHATLVLTRLGEERVAIEVRPV